jgi:hypothetical protein
MSVVNKPWSYDLSMEKCVGWCFGDLWFTATSTNGDSSDSLQVSMPTDKQSLDLFEQWIATVRQSQKA